MVTPNILSNNFQKELCPVDISTKQLLYLWLKKLCRRWVGRLKKPEDQKFVVRLCLLRMTEATL